MSDSIDPIVNYASTFKTDDVPDPIIKIARNLFLDTVGCIIAGSSAKGIRELKEISDFWGGNRQATIFCFDEKTNAPSAAFLNSVMGHANDYDDTHDGALNHGCVTLVPALLATSEALSRNPDTKFSGSIPFHAITGKDFLAALAIGLDISNRLGMAFIPYLHVGWLPTTLWGPFACAAACGRLLGLDVSKMQNAFGLAYSQIHANRQGLLDGVLSKRVQPGFSSSAGLQAAFFAANNITGAKNIIDGNFGIKELYTDGQIDNQYISEGIGNFFETVNVSIKPYPCCRCTHPVIDAALTLKKEHNIDWQKIREGTIYLPPQSMGQIGSNFTIRDNPTVDAQFSAQYTAALAFINGWPKMEDFTKETVLSRKDVTQLASKFKVIEFEKDQSSLVPIELNVSYGTDKKVNIRISDPKGSKNNPLNPEDLVFKFNNCLDNSVKEYSAKDRKKILKVVDDFADLEDINEFIKLL